MNCCSSGLGTIIAVTPDCRVDRKPTEQIFKEDESLVTCQTIQGTEIRGTLLRISRHLAVFEVYNAQLVLRLSEVLKDFRVLVAGRPSYVGRAVISSVVHTGTMLLCEATLEDAWVDGE